MRKIGIIGGSGLYHIDGLTQAQELNVFDTPFGQPSDHIITGVLNGVEVVFLARHGKGHHISPSEINYRANIYEMKRLGVDAIISVSACGSLQEEMKPMDFVVPNQFVDRTVGRQSTFFTGGIVAHVSMADPISSEVAGVLIESAKKLKLTVHEKGTYVNMEGPQFSTRAESHLYRKWGMDIIGMTNCTEAKLAREAEIAYASLCAVTDYDCWRPAAHPVTVEEIIGYLNKNIDNAKKILRLAIPLIAAVKKFAAEDALKDAIITNPQYIHDHHKQQLGILISKYIKD